MNQEDLELLHVLVKVFDSLDAHKTPSWLSRFFNTCAKVLTYRSVVCIVSLIMLD